MAVPAAFRYLQFGQQSAFATAVAATTIFPCDPGSGEFTIDRATESPDEDHGTAIRHQPGRQSTGVRLATASISSPLRFQDFGHILQMGMAAEATAGSGTVTHTYTGDVNSSTTVVPYTVEIVDGTQAWEANGVLADSFDLGFDALSAPGNSMWTINANLKAWQYVTTTATGSLTVPTTLETAEGHLTTLSEGSTSTAFGSLSELDAHLISYRVSVDAPKMYRAYGDTSIDYAVDWDPGKRETSIEASFKLSASSISDFFDIFNVSGSVPTARRWRVLITGSGLNTISIDHRIVFTDVHVNPDGRDGERTVDVSGYAVYDSTLATDLTIIQTGANTALA